MKKVFLLLVLSAVSIFLVGGQAFAITLGADVTVNDEIPSHLWGTPLDDRPNVRYPTYTDEQYVREDGETEDGTASGQRWDLEMFDLNGSYLSAIGGFNFATGETSGSNTFKAGDIFISTDGWTDPSSEWFDPTGYNFVFDMDYASETYDIYQIMSGTTFLNAYYTQFFESNPYRINNPGAGNTAIASGSMTIESGLSDGDVGGMLGGTHYAVTVDMLDLYAGLYGVSKEIIQAAIAAGTIEASFVAHLTMECGNDTLMGQGEYTGGDPIPEPGTMLLLGTGLIGIAGIGRKRLQKNNCA